jgi:hypothetical protein
VEALTTRVPITWEQSTPATITGTGVIDGVIITLTISSLVYSGYNGCNLAFATDKDGEPVEVFRNEFGQSASKIIGAVVNGFNEKLTDFNFDFLCLAAKDNVDKRASLYLMIAERFARSRQMHARTVAYGENKVVIMINHDLPLDLIKKLEQQGSSVD